MEDQTTRTVYEDYKFVERKELARYDCRNLFLEQTTEPLASLGLDHLIGTPALKPYMHGYFLSLKLYDTARVIANPFAYEEHRDKQIKEKMDKLADTRIRARKDVDVKINKALAERVQREEEREKKRQEKKTERLKAKAAAAGNEDAMAVDQELVPSPNKQTLLNDTRFSALFEDPEFQVDESTREFALMNPSLAAQRLNYPMAGQDARRRVKTAVEEEEEESDRLSSDGFGESEEEDSHSDDSSDAGGTFTYWSTP
jgi:ribosome biogenesis protein ENP2